MREEIREKKSLASNQRIIRHTRCPRIERQPTRLKHRSKNYHLTTGSPRIQHLKGANLTYTTIIFIIIFIFI
jgi:hypothetical protein